MSVVCRLACNTLDYRTPGILSLHLVANDARQTRTRIARNVDLSRTGGGWLDGCTIRSRAVRIAKQSTVTKRNAHVVGSHPSLFDSISGLDARSENRARTVLHPVAERIALFVFCARCATCSANF